MSRMDSLHWGMRAGRASTPNGDDGKTGRPRLAKRLGAGGGGYKHVGAAGGRIRLDHSSGIAAPAQAHPTGNQCPETSVVMCGLGVPKSRWCFHIP